MRLAEAERRHRLLLAVALACGAGWGALPVLIAGAAPLDRRILLGAVLAAVCTGALAALGPLRSALHAFLVPALLPFAALMLLQADAIGAGVGLVALLFLASLAWTGHGWERAAAEAFRTGQSNAALARRLTFARDEAEGAAQAQAQLIARLEESRRDAETANQAKSTFLAIMSHELRTPLNAIIGFADVIRSEALGPLENARYREYIDDIRDSGTHLLELINKILDLSKIEAGKFELAPQRLSTEPVARSVLRLFGEQATATGVRLELRVEAAAASIRADERALKQMLINLISNALKFAPRGTAIEIAARTAEDATEISVTDRGIGIAPEDIGKAVAPFSQLGDPMTRRHEGTGLGLSLVKALVELHGGSLAIESRPGRGTTVRLRFPARAETSPEAGAIEEMSVC